MSFKTTRLNRQNPVEPTDTTFNMPKVAKIIDKIYAKRDHERDHGTNKEKAHSLEWADSYLIWTYLFGGDGGESNSPSRREPKVNFYRFI